MATQTTKIAPPNSLILISDVDGGDVPKSMDGALVSATKSCVVVGCLCEIDGPTELTLLSLAHANRTDLPVFVGTLETPQRRVIVSTVHGQLLLEQPVSHEVSAIKVWVNDDREPDKIVVGVGP
ncbi:MAG TPA: hypothetical protein VGN36_03895 [Sphingorhabdus sp.]|jgi:hypothetical protein|nr:hypothetical protein [Sphingorhabdus sp.]